MPTTKSTTLSHPKGWTIYSHYSHMGYHCGQSCPCCRAHLYINKIDPDAYFGACTICLSKKSK